MDGGRVHDARQAAQRRKAGNRSERRAWARGVLDGIVGQLRPGDLCLDCGANAGEVAEPLARTGAEVFAFETDPVAFDALSLRLAPLDNAHPIAAAVGLADETGTLHRAARCVPDPRTPTVGSTLDAGIRDGTDAHDVSTRVLSLIDILTTLQAGQLPHALPLPRVIPHRIALLKLDVEGAELDLLPALHEGDLLRPIACTLVETHQRKFPARRRDFLSMRRQIAGLYPATKVNLDWI